MYAQTKNTFSAKTRFLSTPESVFPANTRKIAFSCESYKLYVFVKIAKLIFSSKPAKIGFPKNNLFKYYNHFIIKNKTMFF